MKIENVVQNIKELDGVLDVQKLLNEYKKDLIKIESTKKRDIIPVINEGLEKCLQRDFCLVVLKNNKFRSPAEPTVLLVTDEGEILGQELISLEDRKKFSKQGNVFFLSKDFVIFKQNRSDGNLHHGKEFFLLPPIPFPELNQMEGISDIISCSPSTLGDTYLKKKYGYPEDPHIATILVGFSCRDENVEGLKKSKK